MWNGRGQWGRSAGCWVGLVVWSRPWHVERLRQSPEPHTAGLSHRPRASAISDASACAGVQNQTLGTWTSDWSGAPHQTQTLGLAAMRSGYRPGRSGPVPLARSCSHRRHSSQRPGGVRADRSSRPSVSVPRITTAAYSARLMAAEARHGAEVGTCRASCTATDAASRTGGRVQSTPARTWNAQTRPRASWCHRARL